MSGTRELREKIKREECKNSSFFIFIVKYLYLNLYNNIIRISSYKG